MLRTELSIERWILYGGSYAANYALAIADQYPDRIESMILDSAYISRVGWQEYYVDSLTEPYRYLFEYCAPDSGCDKSAQSLRQRFWALTEKLEAEPVRLTIEIVSGYEVELLLDGDRLNAALMIGIYEPAIFIDFPAILTDLERDDYRSFEPYLRDYVGFLLDPYWGDISQMAHYCYEDKPSIDFERIEILIEQLPPGFIRDNARVGYDWPDHCARMGITETAPRAIPSRKIETPVLFLHGRLDLVTPLGNVRKITAWFDTFHLLEYDVGHGVLGNALCAHASAILFTLSPGADISTLDRNCREGS
jgi:pimeloyl-ACP methyl ester carboxylesterase